MYITELPVMCCSILSVFVVNGKKKKKASVYILIPYENTFE